MLRATRFRVQNFKSIDDSGWIPLDKVTAFVGRNESGKISLMKALHKFNPATPEPYNPQREFPRDRYTREFRNAADWPVCAVTFEFDNATSQEIGTLLGDDNRPTEVICTKFYDYRIEMVFSPMWITTTRLTAGRSGASWKPIPPPARRNWWRFGRPSARSPSRSTLR